VLDELVEEADVRSHKGAKELAILILAEELG
jgi:hypothetical protein